MYRFLILFLFFILSCNNNLGIDKKNWIKDSFLISLGDNYYLKKSKKPYVLKDTLIIPKNTVLIIKNSVDLIIKNNGCIINNGSLFFGENNLDSLFFFNDENLINKSFIYNLNISSNDKLEIKNNNNLIFNNTKLKSVSIYNKSELIINNSLIINSSINSNNSNIKIRDSFLNESFFYLNNSSVFFNNLIVKNCKKISINSCENLIINNCLLYNNSSIDLNNSINNSIINNIFYKNNKALIIKNKDGYNKLFNNLFVKNKISLELKDSSIVYIINNNFDNNDIAIKALLKNKTNNFIISKKNIYSFNLNDFKLKNNKINHSYCISNKDTLFGYYNIFNNPLYINSKKFNYNLDSLSSAKRSANNNKNLGININNINNIKYLK